jgi:hypothetical protein
MKKIAILFHENDKNFFNNYLIIRLADIWRSEGMEVIPVFGTKRFMPADIAILHINLSVVPNKYIEFAQKYPTLLNGAAKDIRKSTFIENVVRQGDGYKGKVIIKSNLNYAGAPERRLQNCRFKNLFLRLMKRIDPPGLQSCKHIPDLRKPSDYIILDSPDLIPDDWFNNKDIVIQKFLPEMNQGCYCIRNYYFLGDRFTCLLRKARHPIVNAESTISLEPVDVHTEIASLRSKLRFDYGKFDYVIYEDSPVLLDINKTIGSSKIGAPFYPLLRPNLAAGIHSYFSEKSIPASEFETQKSFQYLTKIV